MFKALPWTAGTALIRLHALSSWTGWLVHAGLLPKASLSDHPPPRCDDDCYDSADKGQSKMSQAMGWTDGGYTGFGGMKEEGKMNWKLLPHTIFQRKTTWRLLTHKKKKNTGGDFSSDVFVFCTKSVVYSCWSLLGSVNTRSLNKTLWVGAHSVTQVNRAHM